MSMSDKFQHKAEEVVGQAKEAVGDVTDDQDLQAEGAVDQVKAKAKQVGDDLKDAAEDVKDILK